MQITSIAIAKDSNNNPKLKAKVNVCLNSVITLNNISIYEAATYTNVVFPFKTSRLNNSIYDHFVFSEDDQKAVISVIQKLFKKSTGCWHTDWVNKNNSKKICKLTFDDFDVLGKGVALPKINRTDKDIIPIKIEVNIVPCPYDDIAAYANLYFGDEFVIQNIQIIQTDQYVKVCMPNKKIGESYIDSVAFQNYYLKNIMERIVSDAFDLVKSDHHLYLQMELLNTTKTIEEIEFGDYIVVEENSFLPSHPLICTDTIPLLAKMYYDNHILSFLNDKPARGSPVYDFSAYLFSNGINYNEISHLKFRDFLTMYFSDILEFYYKNINSEKTIMMKLRKHRAPYKKIDFE